MNEHPHVSRAAALVGLLLFFTPLAGMGEEKRFAEEYDVKAAFLLSFSQFIKWPTPLEPSSPFVIGVIGENSFGHLLDDAVNKKSPQGRFQVVSKFRNLSELGFCHILFISASEKSRMRSILEAVRGKPILTVSEVDGFTTSGGMINFYIDHKRVRFEINLAVVEAEQIRISAQLLKLARLSKQPRQ